MDKKPHSNVSAMKSSPAVNLSHKIVLLGNNKRWNVSGHTDQAV